MVEDVRVVDGKAGSEVGDALLLVRSKFKMLCSHVRNGITSDLTRYLLVQRFFPLHPTGPVYGKHLSPFAPGIFKMCCPNPNNARRLRTHR